ncbi:MAG: transcription antitermination factor NusB [Rhodospirillales bacterium]|jgi:N utilization substance protein B|nr:transcription antitermination factor NusB [Rhodospirillales bacterium]|tara:strand:+ start:343 stop:849 length:507 start_codon:yes stop_codon:yes gene_type:complete
MSEGAEASLGQRRRAARLAAVQALYQMELAASTADDVIGEFADRRDAGGDEGLTPREVDGDLFDDLVRGVASRIEEIDGVIVDALTSAWKIDRLELLVRLILRAGAYELISRADIDPPLTINEYVEVANAFFEGGEGAFVNGVLDGLAQRLRADEMGDRAGERPPTNG